MECKNRKKIPRSNAWMCVDHNKVLDKNMECSVCNTPVMKVVEKITLTPELVREGFVSGKKMDKRKNKTKDTN